MPRHRLLVAVAALPVALLAACSSGSSTTSATPAASSAGSGGAAASAATAPAGLNDPKKLTVCIDVEYPPMEYFENGTDGKVIGFDADAARALAAKWGVEPVFANTAFDGLMPALTAKRCDVLWSGLYLSPKRQQVADGVAYLKTGPSLVVPTGNPKQIANPDSLCGLKVAVQGASANEGTLKDQSAACTKAGKPEVTIQAYPKVPETVAALINGKVDALIETDVAVPDMVKKSGGKLEAKPIFPTTTIFAAYVVKGSPLLPALKQGVADLIADGTLAKVATTYGLDPQKVSAG